MQVVLRALNALVEKKVVETYAIGGAVGAMFYIQAVVTEDVDAFVAFPASGALLDIAPIYSALRDLGGVVEREYVKFDDWLLQVLPAGTSLVEDAIRDANLADFEGVPTRVFTAEYLSCIALETGRVKDFLRLQSFLEQGKVDRVVLRSMVQQYGLGDKLKRAEEILGQAI
jgi:hypothetical protein